MKNKTQQILKEWEMMWTMERKRMRMRKIWIATSFPSFACSMGFVNSPLKEHLQFECSGVRIRNSKGKSNQLEKRRESLGDVNNNCSVARLQFYDFNGKEREEVSFRRY